MEMGLLGKWVRRSLDEGAKVLYKRAPLLINKVFCPFGSEACRGKKKVLTSCVIYFITNPEVMKEL
jgi:hypothetical protein